MFYRTLCIYSLPNARYMLRLKRGGQKIRGKKEGRKEEGKKETKGEEKEGGRGREQITNKYRVETAGYDTKKIVINYFGKYSSDKQ